MALILNLKLSWLEIPFILLLVEIVTKLIQNWFFSLNLFVQGGTVAILCAMERPHFFTGVVLSAPAIMANPETASRGMVNQGGHHI